MPKVSIITPCHNSGKFISDTINSVLLQTFSDWEMLITDDCSTDNSVEIIETFVEKDNRIKSWWCGCKKFSNKTSARKVYCIS